MRKFFGTIETRTGVNEPGYEISEPPVAEEPLAKSVVRYAINPAGVLIACIGSLMLVIGAFLPLDEPASSFGTVQSNGLIQHGGWTFILFGVAIALAAYRSYTAGRRGWTVIVLALIALAFAIGDANNTQLRTLYPIGADGTPDSSQAGTVVALGIAIYVVGVGAALAAIGGWVMRQAPQVASILGGGRQGPSEVKACPDCAETVLAAAKVCKHCGHRFAQSAEMHPA